MNAEAEAFVKDFDALCQRHGLGFDDALEVLATSTWEDGDRQVVGIVRDLLHLAAEQLRTAAFNIYASYK